MPTILLWVITISLFAVGLLGTVIPALPGTGFIFAGVLIYGLITSFSTISVPTVVVFGVVAGLTWLANYMGAAYGARTGGGKKLALAGTVVGAIIGVLAAGPIGLLVGAFIGALLGSLAEGQSTHEAAKVAVWSMVGVVGGAMVQFIISVSMIIAFFLAVLL